MFRRGCLALIRGSMRTAARTLPSCRAAFRAQVGEHLLTLLQNLEPFANSDAFHDAAEATDDLHLLPDATRR